MKRRIYLITALALINIVIMKYQEVRREQQGNSLSVSITTNSIDSLLKVPSE